MNLCELLSPERTFASDKPLTKKQAFELISNHLANDTGLDANELTDAFWLREKLGSSFVGNGVAIPHVLSTEVQNPFVTLVKLPESITKWDEPNTPVDLIIAAIVPHVNLNPREIITELVQRFTEPGFLDALRHTHNTRELYQTVLCHETTHP